jgi:cytochrome c oxidase subunit IV
MPTFSRLYSSHGKDFQKHVHKNLQRRLRLFFIISAIMFLLALFDVYNGTLTIGIALISIVIGSVVGFISSRIFHLSWEKDGEVVVGRIDTVGWIVLVAYILFEIARTTFFSDVLHLAASATAITYVFVASALISRVLGLRGRMLRILKEEKVFE